MFNKNMLNEKSNIWLKIFKILIIVMFFACIIFGFVAGIGDVTSEFLDCEIGGDTIFDFVVWFLIGIVGAFFELVGGMLILQLLNNVQIIRENIEKN